MLKNFPTLMARKPRLIDGELPRAFRVRSTCGCYKDSKFCKTKKPHLSARLLFRKICGFYLAKYARNAIVYLIDCFIAALLAKAASYLFLICSGISPNLVVSIDLRTPLGSDFFNTPASLASLANSSERVA